MFYWALLVTSGNVDENIIDKRDEIRESERKFGCEYFKAWGNQNPSDIAERPSLPPSKATDRKPKNEDETVKVLAKNIIMPVNTIREMKLHSHIQANVNIIEYDELFPIQKFIIPNISLHRDIFVMAPHSSGKSFGYILPILDVILKNGPAVVPQPLTLSNGRICRFPLALILTPNTETSEKIYNAVTTLSQNTVLSVVIFNDEDTNEYEQDNKLKVG